MARKKPKPGKPGKPGGGGGFSFPSQPSPWKDSRRGAFVPVTQYGRIRMKNTPRTIVP